MVVLGGEGVGAEEDDEFDSGCSPVTPVVEQGGDLKQQCARNDHNDHYAAFETWLQCHKQQSHQNQELQVSESKGWPISLHFLGFIRHGYPDPAANLPIFL